MPRSFHRMRDPAGDSESFKIPFVLHTHKIRSNYEGCYPSKYYKKMCVKKRITFRDLNYTRTENEVDFRER